MKIFATGDIHGDTRLAENLAKKAESENVDLVVICGDITHNHGPSDNLIGPFVKRKLKVVFVPGNHDSFTTADFLQEVYGIKNIHGKSTKYNDVGFFGCGGANLGIERLEESEIYDLLKLGHDQIKEFEKKIMITHVHPEGSKIEKFTSIFKGSSGVRKALDKFQPDLLFCCHVHEAEGIEEKIGKTKVINVGKNGKIIEI